MSTPRLLIVDDNPSIHRDFDLVLLDTDQNAALEADEARMFGHASQPAPPKPAYTLDHASSGLDGLAKVKQALKEERPYQVTFVDIRMPGIDGVETIQRIWQLDPRIQVVICTAFADYSWADLTRRLGQTDKLLVLKKPFDNIEVTLLASTLTEKWYLARRAALKLEQLELLVARRTQNVLELQGHHPQSGPLESSPASQAELERANHEVAQVLIIAPDAELRHHIRESLPADCQALEASDRETALRESLEAVPNLIVATQGLAPLDGLGLCREFKAAQLTSHIPVILLATAGASDAHLHALEAGADECLELPLQPLLLRARADKLLRSGRQLYELLDQDLSTPSHATNQLDADFLRRAMDIVEAHMSDFEFNVDVMAQKLAVSRRQLFRKLKALTGNTPNAFLRSMRLKHAAKLLQASPMTVTEVTYAVGFADLKHFRAVFRDQFGVLPAEYAKKSPNKA